MEEQRTAGAILRRSEQENLPGLWPAVIVATIFGILSWYWLTSGIASEAAASDDEAVASELARVDDQDLTAALTTMNGSNAFLSRFGKRSENCPEPLAWISLARLSGEAPGTVRIQSGSYFSPVFTLSTTPVRVAIPFPSPYETGIGKLIVHDAGGAATVALQPVWHVPVQSGAAAHDVMWHPIKQCTRPHG